MRNIVAAIILLLQAHMACAQNQAVFTADIDHFREAYDSIKTTSDSLKQLNYIQKLYIDRGTEGLHAFMKRRNYTAEGWVKLVNQYPRFRNSIRPNTYRVKTASESIEKSIAVVKQLILSQVLPVIRPIKKAWY